MISKLFSIERLNVLYDFFKLIFHIEFFLVPISAGFLSWAAIKGKNKRPYLMALVISSVMFVLSFIGVYVNSEPEIRESMQTEFAKSLSIEE